jgi:hypothetical protein
MVLNASVFISFPPCELMDIYLRWFVSVTLRRYIHLFSCVRNPAERNLIRSVRLFLRMKRHNDRLTDIDDICYCDSVKNVSVCSNFGEDLARTKATLHQDLHTFLRVSRA